MMTSRGPGGPFAPRDRDLGVRLLSAGHSVASDLPVSGVKTQRPVRGHTRHDRCRVPGGLTYAIGGLTAEDHRLAAEVVSTGRHLNGKLSANNHHFLFTVRSGQIVAVNEYMDTRHLHDFIYQTGHRQRREHFGRSRVRSAVGAHTATTGVRDPGVALAWCAAFVSLVEFEGFGELIFQDHDAAGSINSRALIGYFTHAGSQA